MPSILPNYFPIIPAKHRLAVIAACATPHDFGAGRPLGGSAGNLLNGALEQLGIQPSSIFRGNVCQSVPPGGDIEHLDKSSFEIQNGVAQLKKDLNEFQPNCTLYLGQTPLWFAGIHHKSSVFRGTIFRDSMGRKGVASLSPDYVLKVWDDAPLFNFDVGRAVGQSYNSELQLPQRTLHSRMSAPECIQRLNAITKGATVSVDIEGGVPDPTATTHKNLDGVTCIGISTDPSSAFIIPLQDFEDLVKIQVMKAFCRMMADPDIPKVLQNSLYDYTVLAWLWKIPTANIAYDTMMSGWEIYPELPKSLGVQASVWTEEPYYKFERTLEKDNTERDAKTIHYEYCCKDAAVTLEIHNAHMAAMNPSQRAHYDFNMSLVPSLQYMTLRGMKYDQQGNDQYKAEVETKMLELQLSCNNHAKQEINLNSPKQMTELLYRKLGFEPMYAVEKGRKTNKLTADKDALLKLAVKGGQHVHPFLTCALAWKKLEGARKQLEIGTDKDGRVRCSYNLVGADTGRLSCSGSVTGSGTNLQTIMKKLRKYYIADPGYHYFQCDLEGADGWTVAAHSAALGDPTMIDDYYFGLKPAKILALMHLVGPQINDLSRAELKALIKSTPIPPHIYAVCKVIQHGSSYLMGERTMSDNILERSFKDSDDFNLLYIPPSDCKRFQALFFKRYSGILSWHRSVEIKLRDGHSLPCASGHVRTFFGRPGDKQLLKSACAHEPQANTTYVTNLAMQRLWQDPENRDSRNGLIIQPLHSVHDALCGQFPIERTEWAVNKINSWFNNRVRIANEQILIPYEGGYGPTWYDTDENHRLGAI